MELDVKKGPLITVITATYNLRKNQRIKYVKQCIESVQRQTYSNIEHIVIDGASTDGTLDLLREYERIGWIKLYSAPDNGIYDAMNKGISMANGKYVNILNSDDFFHDEKGVEINVEYLERNNLDYTFGDARVLKSWGRESLWKGDISKLPIGSHYCHQTMFVKTTLLRSMNGFDISYRVSADSDLMIRLYVQKYKYMRVPYCFVTYRKGGYSNQHEEQMRIDHSTSFYRHIGQYADLSQRDCFLLWHARFFVEEMIANQMKLIDKVPIEFCMEYLLREYQVRVSYLNVARREKIYLFGGIPIGVRQMEGDNVCSIVLLNLIKILKIVDFNSKRKYYLLGFLPILKVKRYL